MKAQTQTIKTVGEFKEALFDAIKHTRILPVGSSFAEFAENVTEYYEYCVEHGIDVARFPADVTLKRWYAELTTAA